MLHIVLWKWNQPGFREAYTAEHVNVMAAMLRRYLGAENYRIVCVTDDPGEIDMAVEVYPLWKDHDKLDNVSGKHLPSCYRRLRLFDPSTQVLMGIKSNDRILSLDLDTIICNDLRPIVGRKERWIGWAVRGTRHIRVFNGSLFMFTAGDFSEIWSEFNKETSPATALKAGFFGSDQGWLSYKLAAHPECAGVSYPQVASYPRELRTRPMIPPNCSVVFFHGRQKPWHADVQKTSPWVKAHWRKS